MAENKHFKNKTNNFVKICYLFSDSSFAVQNSEGDIVVYANVDPSIQKKNYTVQTLITKEDIVSDGSGLYSNIGTSDPLSQSHGEKQKFFSKKSHKRVAPVRLSKPRMAKVSATCMAPNTHRTELILMFGKNVLWNIL